MIDGVRHLIYNEDLGTKTNHGGLKHKQNPVKEVIIFPQPNRARCPVAIFYLYHCKIPLKRKTEALYLHPCKNYSPDSWYEDHPIGVNALKTTVKRMCEKVRLERHYSNHSLCETSATRMYQAGIEEQVVTEVTGHRSLAVHCYKKTGLEQKRKASHTLSCSPIELCEQPVKSCRMEAMNEDNGFDFGHWTVTKIMNSQQLSQKRAKIKHSQVCWSISSCSGK